MAEPDEFLSFGYFVAVMNVAGFALMTSLTWSRVRERSRAGALVLRLGMEWMPKTCIWIFAFYSGAGTAYHLGWFCRSVFIDNESLDGLTFLVVGSSILLFGAIFVWIVSSLRLWTTEFREHAILRNGTLLEWNQFGWHRWKPTKKGFDLSLQHHRGNWKSVMLFKVPADSKSRLENLLIEKLDSQKRHVDMAPTPKRISNSLPCLEISR